MRSLIFLLIFLLGVIATPAQADWQARHYSDEFTDVQICRVIQGGVFSRTFLRHQAVYALYFYAENVDGEYRAGIRSEPVFPIGDIQIRADDNAMVLLGPETAIDDMPNSTGLSAEPYIREDATAEERAAFESAMATTNDMLVAAMSPYRALQGQEALDLLNQVVNSERVIYRMVGANVALSQTGEFEPDSSLATALANCDIPVDIEPDAPLSQETDGRGQNEIDDYEYD